MGVAQQNRRCVFVIGANGKVGAALVQHLAERGDQIVAVGRAPFRSAQAPSVESRIADIQDPSALRTALRDARFIVSAGPAHLLPEVVAALPADVERAVLFGSTRKFTRFRDDVAESVRSGERAFIDSGKHGVVLHPTMIYGTAAQDVVRRLAHMVRKLSVFPLPAGGGPFVQPVHVDDVVCAAANALKRGDAPGPPIVVAGPTPICFGEMVRSVARATGCRASVMPMPAAVFSAMAGVVGILPGVSAERANQVRRLLEDRSFDISDMTDRLGIDPISFDEGLRRTFG